MSNRKQAAKRDANKFSTNGRGREKNRFPWIAFAKQHGPSSPWLVCEHLPRVVVHRPEWHIGICSTIVRARDVTLTDSAFPFRYISMRRVVCITRNAYPVTRELRRSPSSVIYSELLIVSGICDDLTFYTSCVTIIMGKDWNKNSTKMIWWIGIFKWKFYILNVKFWIFFLKEIDFCNEEKMYGTLRLVNSREIEYQVDGAIGVWYPFALNHLFLGM